MSMGCRLKDHTGEKIGSLTVVSLYHKVNKQNKRLWICKCDCGNQIIETINHIRALKNICGYQCKKESLIGFKFHKLEVIDRDLTKHLGNRRYWVCKCDCGKLTTITGSNIRKGKIKSCGCQRLDKNNHFYKHGRHKFPNHYNRNNSLYNRWRKSIKNRDKYTCQICGVNKPSKELDAHHLDSYLQYPKKRYDLDNGITLCKHCHRSFHNKYGTITTKNQFLEFIMLMYYSDWCVTISNEYLNDKNRIEEDYLLSINEA